VGRHILFLEELVAQLFEDAYEYTNEHRGEDPSGMLADFEREAAWEGVYLDQHYWSRRLRAAMSWCEQWVEHSRLPDREKLDMLDVWWARGGGRRGQPATTITEEPGTRG
jgi:hypothetical protein